MILTSTQRPCGAAEKWEQINGLVAQNAAAGMALTSPVMNLNGVTDGRENKSVITTCVAGVRRDVLNVLKENVEGQETVQSQEKGNDVTVIDQKMVITPMVTTQSRITEGSLGRRRRAKPSCSGACLLMSLKMIFVLP